MKLKINNGGFTLIELIVVVAILSVLITMILVTINPVRQLEKAKDAQRQHDIFQIRNALDTYYNDNNHYPLPTGTWGFPFGSEFNSGSTVYLQKTPQDPDFSNGGDSYIYQVDGSSSPQWNVLYAKLSSADNLQTSCPLLQLKNSSGGVCVPINYQSLGYNYCLPSGKVNCDYISSSMLPGPLPTPIPTSSSNPSSSPAPTSLPTASPTSSPVPTVTPTPTPTPPPFDCSVTGYFAVSSGRCNSVTKDQCTIYPPGSLTCYSGPGTSSCSGNLCTK